MKRKPRWTLEMLTASLAVLCGLLLLVLLVQVFQTAGTLWATRSDKRLRK